MDTHERYCDLWGYTLTARAFASVPHEERNTRIAVAFSCASYSRRLADCYRQQGDAVSAAAWDRLSAYWDAEIPPATPQKETTMARLETVHDVKMLLGTITQCAYDCENGLDAEQWDALLDELHTLKNNTKFIDQAIHVVAQKKVNADRSRAAQESHES